MGIPIGSMYGIFIYMYHILKPNVGKYTVQQPNLFRKCLDLLVRWKKINILFQIVVV